MSLSSLVTTFITKLMSSTAGVLDQYRIYCKSLCVCQASTLSPSQGNACAFNRLSVPPTITLASAVHAWPTSAHRERRWLSSSQWNRDWNIRLARVHAYVSLFVFAFWTRKVHSTEHIQQLHADSMHQWEAEGWFTVHTFNQNQSNTDCWTEVKYAWRVES